MPLSSKAGLFNWHRWTEEAARSYVWIHIGLRRPFRCVDAVHLTFGPQNIWPQKNWRRNPQNGQPCVDQLGLHVWLFRSHIRLSQKKASIVAEERHCKVGVTGTAKLWSPLVGQFAPTPSTSCSWASGPFFANQWVDAMTQRSSEQIIGQDMTRSTLGGFRLQRFVRSVIHCYPAARW